MRSNTNAARAARWMVGVLAATGALLVAGPVAAQTTVLDFSGPYAA